MKPINAYTELHLTTVNSSTDKANATLKIEWSENPEDSYELRIPEPAHFDNWVKHIKAYIQDCGQKVAKVSIYAHTEYTANDSALKDMGVNAYVALFVDYQNMVANS